jgi:hypothetical protein
MSAREGGVRRCSNCPARAKPEGRDPKSELMRVSLFFGLRASAFFRTSAFGFRASQRLRY